MSTVSAPSYREAGANETPRTPPTHIHTQLSGAHDALALTNRARVSSDQRIRLYSGLIKRSLRRSNGRTVLQIITATLNILPGIYRSVKEDITLF